MKLVSKRDLPSEERLRKGQLAVDSSPFLGVWVNTNEDQPRKIQKVEIRDRDGKAGIRVFGDCEGEPCDWGEVLVDVFADSVNSNVAMSFSAVYDLDFVETYLQANLKHGTLVVASCNKFRDGSARSNYYTREFFYRLED